MSDGRGSLRPGPTTGGAQLVDGGDGHEDRPLACGGGGRQDERESGLHRWAPRPWRALLWRGQRLRVRRVAGDVSPRDQGTGRGGRDLSHTSSTDRPDETAI